MNTQRLFHLSIFPLALLIFTVFLMVPGGPAQAQGEQDVIMSGVTFQLEAYYRYTDDSACRYYAGPSIIPPSAKCGWYVFSDSPRNILPDTTQQQSTNIKTVTQELLGSPQDQIPTSAMTRRQVVSFSTRVSDLEVGDNIRISPISDAPGNAQMVCGNTSFGSTCTVTIEPFVVEGHETHSYEIIYEREPLENQMTMTRTNGTDLRVAQDSPSDAEELPIEFEEEVDLDWSNFNGGAMSRVTANGLNCYVVREPRGGGIGDRDGISTDPSGEERIGGFGSFPSWRFTFECSGDFMEAGGSWADSGFQVPEEDAVYLAVDVQLPDPNVSGDVTEERYEELGAQWEEEVVLKVDLAERDDLEDDARIGYDIFRESEGEYQKLNRGLLFETHDNRTRQSGSVRYRADDDGVVYIHDSDTNPDERYYYYLIAKDDRPNRYSINRIEYLDSDRTEISVQPGGGDSTGECVDEDAINTGEPEACQYPDLGVLLDSDRDPIEVGETNDLDWEIDIVEGGADDIDICEIRLSGNHVWYWEKDDGRSGSITVGGDGTNTTGGGFDNTGNYEYSFQCDYGNNDSASDTTSFRVIDSDTEPEPDPDTEFRIFWEEF